MVLGGVVAVGSVRLREFQQELDAHDAAVHFGDDVVRLGYDLGRCSAERQRSWDHPDDDHVGFLEALSVRAELVERLVRWRWLVIEQARAAGATWAEVDDAARLVGGSCVSMEYNKWTLSELTGRQLRSGGFVTTNVRESRAP